MEREWRKNPNEYDYKPLRQGDLDSLCGVYAVLNALQWLVPAAQNPDFLTKLFEWMVEEKIILIDHVREGGDEPEIDAVHAFVAKAVKKKFKVDFNRVPRGADRFGDSLADKPLQVNLVEKMSLGVLSLRNLPRHCSLRNTTSNATLRNICTHGAAGGRRDRSGNIFALHAITFAHD